jgi:hypothetical protein
VVIIQTGTNGSVSDATLATRSWLPAARPDAAGGVPDGACATRLDRRQQHAHRQLPARYPNVKVVLDWEAGVATKSAS